MTPRWRKIVIHHSASPDGAAFTWPSLWRYHVEVKGYDDVAYHRGVERVGDRYQAVIGRPLTMVGAHCLGGVNDWAIGVCTVGNFSLEPPSEEMLRYLCSHVLKELFVAYGLGPEDVLFHRELWPTECPGKHFRKEMLLEILEES